MKQRPNSQANLLRTQGVPALGTYSTTGTNFNPIGFYKPEKSKYKEILTVGVIFVKNDSHHRCILLPRDLWL